MKWISNSPEETQALAKKLLATFPRIKVICLRGPLGSGKTCFVKGIGQELGLEETQIKSPTFIIFRKSKIKNKKFLYFYHFDVYRINSEKEILNLGWKEIISNPENIVLVEWADKIEKILPKNSVKINFKHLKGDKREIEIAET